MVTSKSAELKTVLDRLEKAYGTLHPSGDPVEAGVMTLLAEHAPHLDADGVCESLRAWFVDWNEARVADPWDVTNAIDAGGDAGARAFAKATLRFLRSLHEVLNRCAFDRALADPDTDIEKLIGRMRGAPPATRAVMLAVLDGEEGWHVSNDMSKLAQSLGLIPRTTSARKAGKSLEGLARPVDRLRAHYLLARYAARDPEGDDPLSKPRARKKAAAKKPASSRKPAAKKASSRKPAAKKASSSRKPAKKAAAKKPAKRTSSRRK
jgi:endonuclease III